MVKDQNLRPSIKDLFNEPLIKRTMEEFVENKGFCVEAIEYPLKLQFSLEEISAISNISRGKLKTCKSCNSEVLSKKLQSKNSAQFQEQNDYSSFSIGNTVYSVDLNEEHMPNQIEFADRTIQSKNESTNFEDFSPSKKNSFGDTAYENIPIKKKNVRKKIVKKVFIVR